MYKRDLITTEIEKLAEALVKILGFKKELKIAEAESLLIETLSKNFGLSKDVLYDHDLISFEAWLSTQNLPAEKLDMLSQFIFNELGIAHEEKFNRSFALKLQRIYQILASKHHVVHLIHLDREQLIKQYL